MPASKVVLEQYLAKLSGREATAGAQPFERRILSSLVTRAWLPLRPRSALVPRLDLFLDLAAAPHEAAKETDEQAENLAHHRGQPRRHGGAG